MTRSQTIIRRVQPARVRVVWRQDGSTEDITISKRNRKRWDELDRRLEAGAWSELVLLDDEGELLCSLNDPDNATTERRFAITTERGETLQLLTDAQDRVLDRVERFMNGAMRTLERVCDSLAQRVQAADTQHVADMQTVRDLMMAGVDLEDQVRQVQGQGYSDPQQLALMFIAAKAGLLPPAVLQKMFAQGVAGQLPAAAGSTGETTPAAAGPSAATGK